LIASSDCNLNHFTKPCRRTEGLVEELSEPPAGSKPLDFPNRYSRNYMQQFRICLWKNSAVYWWVLFQQAVSASVQRPLAERW